MVVLIKTEEQLLKEGWVNVDGEFYLEHTICINIEMARVLGRRFNIELENGKFFYTVGSREGLDDYTFPQEIIDEEYFEFVQLRYIELGIKKEIGL